MSDKNIHSNNISLKMFEHIHHLLKECINKDDINKLIPANDALRVWWSPEENNLKIKELLEVIKGSNDYLSLLTLIQYARTKVKIPAELEKELTLFLLQSSINFRNSSVSYKSSFHAIISYSHSDECRVKIILSILMNAGLKIFHDVKHIMPGESIVARLHEVMSTV
ncbi:MAG: toll/interleukin-1 receptor domain-containing protein, partial [Bacteroidota bacterium]|nr:toll/interleukin-1 receptor domain-containing protein [Bacteroidota bacterium]